MEKTPMRASGILLHPTSLPGEGGIGDLGAGAYKFVDFLAESGVSLWQVLPLGPPGLGNSPYQCISSMAGNPLLISLRALLEEGLLTPEELRPAQSFPETRVDFESVSPFRLALLKRAAHRFFASSSGERLREFEEFCEQKRSWLDQFAGFVALREMNRNTTWPDWRRTARLNPLRVRDQKFMQFQFFRQWAALKEHCHRRGIRIIGDLPFLVAYDSADVWANPGLFDLDADGRPRAVAGVPPDYFSATGQLWGNPLYDWEAMAREKYAWWIERVKGTLELVDIMRIDHFRGFEKYFAIPRESKTAAHGEWREGPGDRLFGALQDAVGSLPVIAEDLGYITPEVHALRDRWNFPGMRVLQFAFGNDSPTDYFKPYNFINNCVVYTGTHDNDTTVGWLNHPEATQLPEQAAAEREFALRYVRGDGTQIHWDFITTAISSVAHMAIFPMQDVLGLGSEARMNRPAVAENNWRWRLTPDQMDPALSGKLHLLNRTYGRLGAC
jgi:4-alpha-glucanotransferase